MLSRLSSGSTWMRYLLHERAHSLTHPRTHTHAHKDDTLTRFSSSLTSSSLVFPRSLTPGSLVPSAHSRLAHNAEQDMHINFRQHVHRETIHIGNKIKTNRIKHTQRRAFSSHTRRFDPDLGLTGGPRCERRIPTADCAARDKRGHNVERLQTKEEVHAVSTRKQS